MEHPIQQAAEGVHQFWALPNHLVVEAVPGVLVALELAAPPTGLAAVLAVLVPYPYFDIPNEFIG